MKSWVDGMLDWVLNPPEGQGHRRIALIALILSAVMIVTVTFAGVSMAYTFINADNTAAIERNGDTADCRSLFNSRLVGSAGERLDTARAELDLVETELLEAAANQDPEELARINRLLDPAQEAITEAVDVLQAGRESYNALVELSIDDTSEFLRQCEREKNR